MTELEKAKTGKYGEIDLNRLAKELREKNGVFIKTCLGAAKQGRDALEAIDAQFFVAPAMNISYAINAFLNIIGLKEPVIAHMMAAFLCEVEHLKEISDHPEVNEDVALEIAALLRERSVVYATKVPCKREDRT